MTQELDPGLRFAREYDANREALVDSGVALVDEGVRESGRRMFFVNDPDGNLIEITEYNVWGD